MGAEGGGRDARAASGARREAGWLHAGAPPGATAVATGPRGLHHPGCQASAGGAGGRRKGWRCEGRRAGTGAPRCRCNKNASHGTARGEGRDPDAAAGAGGGRPGGRPGERGAARGREVKGLAKFSRGCCERPARGRRRRRRGTAQPGSAARPAMVRGSHRSRGARAPLGRCARVTPPPGATPARSSRPPAAADRARRPGRRQA